MYNKKFVVYNHKLVTENGTMLNKQLIALKDENEKLQFTDFHHYVKNSRNRIANITANGNKQYYYVIKLLNYVYFFRGISKLEDITVDLVEDFLNAYGRCTLPEDTKLTKRSESTVKMCVAAVMDFLTMFIEDKKTQTKITVDDLYKTVNRRDKRGMAIKVKVPRFDVTFIGNKKTIFRDMPNAAFEIILEHIEENHPEILGLVILSAFAGLRPAEACNVRREDSVLGAGLRFARINGNIHDIEINLLEEKALRSDLVSVGRIKKERIQNVPQFFLRAFEEKYKVYMRYLNGKKYEAAYGPLSLNKQGKAMTYGRYRQIFRDIIKNEIIEKLEKTNVPELVLYAKTLRENNISPHIFRHWYTVQLVLSGEDNPGVLMAYRGDTSPESALTYLQNKGELEKTYQKVASGVYDYLAWAAKEKKWLN